MRLERLARDKCSRLFGLVICDEEKKFYDIDARRVMWSDKDNC